MRKKSIFFLALLFLVSFPRLPRAFADDMWTKASRGLTNILTGYGEVLYQPAEREKTERWPLAGMAGLFKGVYRGTLRTAAGVIELATFPIPLPRGYEPLMGPEFVVPLADPPSGEKKTDWGT